jgi:hypothetical protein
VGQQVWLIRSYAPSLQSPHHRGSRSTGIAFDLILWLVMLQSPHHREVRSTSELLAGSNRCSLQSPHHRGGRSTTARRPTSFSPLSIGEVAQHRHPRTGLNPHPLACPSVPSSAGRSLTRRMHSMPLTSPSFSPLIIGEIAQLNFFGNSARFLSYLQSPHHRVPHIIGEVAQARGVSQVEGWTGPEFFSPPSSSGSARFATSEFSGCECLQFPHHRGKSLNQRQPRFRIGIGLQSPHHRGGRSPDDDKGPVKPGADYLQSPHHRGSRLIASAGVASCSRNSSFLQSPHQGEIASTRTLVSMGHSQTCLASGPPSPWRSYILPFSEHLHR